MTAADAFRGEEVDHRAAGCPPKGRAAPDGSMSVWLAREGEMAVAAIPDPLHDRATAANL